MARSGDSTATRFSTAVFVVRLVLSIVGPVAAIGAALWWLVADDRVDAAVDQRAAEVARLVGQTLDGELEQGPSGITAVDERAIDASIRDLVAGVVAPTDPDSVSFRVTTLDGSVVYSTTPGEIGEVVGVGDVSASVLRGVPSAEVMSRGTPTEVVYRVPVAVGGATAAAGRLHVPDDRVIAGAVSDAGNLRYLFGGALLAVVIALVPLCWWSLGEVRRQFRRTRQLAMNDNLTGLANRTQFHERLDEAIAGAARSDARVGLVMLDLDGFKAINDTGGHAAGDRLLRRVAAALGEATRRNEIACRLGGDEFAVVAPRIADRDELRGLADRLHDQLDLDVAFSDGRSLRVTASLGLALYPDDATTADGLVNVADVSMYNVKASRKAKLPKSAKQRAILGR